MQETATKKIFRTNVNTIIDLRRQIEHTCGGKHIAGFKSIPGCPNGRPTAEGGIGNPNGGKPVPSVVRIP